MILKLNCVGMPNASKHSTTDGRRWPCDSVNNNYADGALRAEYIGCFKIRNVADTRQADPSHRWYDPHHLVFLGDDSRYAEGPFYALRGSIIRGILRSGLAPRLGGPEGRFLHHRQLGDSNP